ncbi:hypothetical protein Bbelb_132720 [Branchiostoma belcheri]|nr:hypothetical protein Bbelb_132720 [Branchiostoma belcheri]
MDGTLADRRGSENGTSGVARKDLRQNEEEDNATWSCQQVNVTVHTGTETQSGMAEESPMKAIPASKKLLCALLFTGILFQYAGRTSVSVVLVELQMPSDNRTHTNVTQVQYSQFQVGVILSSVYIGLLPSSFIGATLPIDTPLLVCTVTRAITPAVIPRRHCCAVTQKFYRNQTPLCNYTKTFCIIGSPIAMRIPNHRQIRPADREKQLLTEMFRTIVKPPRGRISPSPEGLCEPAAYGVLSERLLPTQSAKVSPFVFAGLYLGQFLGIIATGFITQNLVWQIPFYLFGGLGLTWTVLLVGYEAVVERKNKDVDSANEHVEDRTKRTDGIPFCQIFTSPAVWASILLQVAAYCWEPNILPLYFNQSFGASIELVGVLAGIPVLIFGALEPIFALVGNRLSKRFSSTISRKALAMTGCLGVSGCLLVAAFTTNSVVAACFVAVAYGSSAARAAAADANPFDIAPRYASVLCGMCRVLCRVVGITFPLLVTTLTKNKTTQEWSNVVVIIACVFAATGFFYGVFGSGEEQPWATDRLQDGGVKQNQDGDFTDRMRPRMCNSTESTWL